MNNENTIYDNPNRNTRDEETQFDSKAAGNENTRYDNAADESTQFDDNRFADNKPTEPTNAPVQPKKMSMGKRVAIAFGASAALGGAAAMFMSATPAENVIDEDKPEDESDNGDDKHPDWTDGEVPVAQGVNDGMSFGEAFNAARAEVGSGGVFEWHGYIYSTYTAEEWDAMSQEDRDAYGSHFNWSAQPAANEEAEVVSSTPNGGAHATTADNSEPDYVAGANGGNAEVVAVSDDEISDDEVEVEILGVEHDAESGVTYAQLNYDNHDAVLIDINDDNTFDVLAVDANNDHQISQNEIVDISDQNLTTEMVSAQVNHTAGAGQEEQYASMDDHMTVDDGMGGAAGDECMVDL